MPIYEYRCDSCGKGFEELVFSSTKVACPECQGRKVTRQLSVPAPTPQSASAAAARCEMGAPPSSCCGGGACQPH
ncbi:MAG: zinc ribbon domain-containing protein [Gemmatimonadales bacterium]